MQSNQQIVISNKNNVRIDSVNTVKSFDEEAVLIETDFGNIAVEGAELRIESLDKSKSEILITGKITGAYYIEKREKKKGRGLFS